MVLGAEGQDCLPLAPVEHPTSRFAGRKMQDIVSGKPLQERLTSPENPLTGVIVSELLANPPCGAEREVGVAVTVKVATVLGADSACTCV